MVEMLILMVLTGLTSKQLRAFVNLAGALPFAASQQAVEGQTPRSRARRLSPQEIVEIIQRYEAGRSMASIASEFDVLRPSISQLLRRHGVGLRTQRQLDDTSRQRAADLYPTGLSLAEVRDQVGFDGKTIARGLRQLGLELRPKRKYRRLDQTVE